MYNLRVAFDHTYFVGRATWGFSLWVHNEYIARPVADGIYDLIWKDAETGAETVMEEGLTKELADAAVLRGNEVFELPLERPGLNSATRKEIEAAAERNPQGRFVDRKGNIIKRPSFGHKFGFENRRILAAGDQLHRSQDQLKAFVNAHPDYFFIQEYADNIAHVGELAGVGELERIIIDMKKFFGLP